MNAALVTTYRHRMLAWWEWPSSEWGPAFPNDPERMRAFAQAQREVRDEVATWPLLKRLRVRLQVLFL